MPIYYLETDRREYQNHEIWNEGWYWGKIEAEAPEIAELMFKRFVASYLARKHSSSEIKQHAAKRLATRDFTVKEYTKISNRDAFRIKVDL